MSLFFITGSAGSGKTTVGYALRDMGYEVYDADIDGLAKWQNNKTGYVYPKSSISQAQRTPEFLSQHSWVFPRKEAEELAAKAKNKPIFLCGSLVNDDKLQDLFKIAFALYVDEDTLTHRLKTRTTGDWGKQPHELQHTLKHHRRVYKDFRRRGYVIVDATKSVEDVVKIILEKVDG